MSEVDTKITKTELNLGQEENTGWGPGQASSRYLSGTPDLSLRSFRDEAEVRAISSALTQTGWNRKQAARLLSISYRGLLYKIRRHNITRSSGLRNAVAAEGTKIE